MRVDKSIFTHCFAEAYLLVTRLKLSVRAGLFGLMLISGLDSRPCCWKILCLSCRYKYSRTYTHCFVKLEKVLVATYP